MSRKLYLDDSYLRQCEAEVVEARQTDEAWEVVLDRTCFYPESGGQPGDSGTISGIQVLDVRLEGEDVIHVLEAEPPASPLEARIDWRRRYDHMRQHTGQHLLTAAIINLFDVDTVGFHLGEKFSTIDIATSSFSPERAARAEELCSEWITAALPVSTEYVSPEEFQNMELRKKALPEELSGSVRLVRIGDVDIAHCGGTHLRSTAELQMIKVVGTERVRDTVRVTFLAGGRATADYKHKHELLTRLAADLTCGIEDLPATVGKTKEDAKESYKQLKKLRKEMISGMVQSELEKASKVGEFKILCSEYEGWSSDELKVLASKATAVEPKLIICTAGREADRGAIALAAGSAFDGDLGEIIRSLLPLFDGRGGGKGRFAQAVGDASKLNDVLEAANRLLREAV